MKTILIIYLISMLPLAIYMTLYRMWTNHDGGLNTRIAMTFVPILNTFMMIVCVFYIFPDNLIRQHKESEYEKHRTDVRWKLMNLKKYD